MVGQSDRDPMIKPTAGAALLECLARFAAPRAGFIAAKGILRPLKWAIYNEPAENRKGKRERREPS
jgi:hypothetical protein